MTDAASYLSAKCNLDRGLKMTLGDDDLLADASNESGEAIIL